ncbi:MAG TPA: hypothetical protein PKA13_23915 [Geminicoccaceae bacterium]|nr:hypothetical protein [Geminicoccus sp.]HMU52843.1 hypothetical protein [Geminicoccaceae bacterium]
MGLIGHGVADIRRRLKAAEEPLRTAAGTALRRLGLERPEAPLPAEREIPLAFRAWQPDDSAVPIACVTPPCGDFMHSFFDVCPWSASGRYLAVTRLPFVWRYPAPGDLAEVCVIDLERRSLRVVHRTDGWALQLGAHLHWHPKDDRFLFCNERGAGAGAAVRIDLETGELRRYDAPIYTIAPDGGWALSPALDLINASQQGYGVPEPLWRRRRLVPGAVGGEGLHRLDLETGRAELMLSIAELVRPLPAAARGPGATTYLFHVKIAPDGGRVFQVLRSRGLPDRPAAWRSSIVTFEPGGGDLRLALPHQDWDRGGHHPSWLPDGRRILMNLAAEDGGGLRFVSFAWDGSDRRELPGGRRGSGHPSIEPTGRLLVTDAYLNEGFDAPDGLAPLRGVSLPDGSERLLAALDCGPPDLRARRIDPHPVWSRCGRRLAVNACLGGRRQVLLAEMGGLLDALAPAAKEVRRAA